MLSQVREVDRIVAHGGTEDCLEMGAQRSDVDEEWCSRFPLGWRKLERPRAGSEPSSAPDQLRADSPKPEPEAPSICQSPPLEHSPLTKTPNDAGGPAHTSTTCTLFEMGEAKLAMPSYLKLVTRWSRAPGDARRPRSDFGPMFLAPAGSRPKWHWC